MSARTRSSVIVAGLFILVACALAITALFAPFWFTVEFFGLELNKGLVRECVALPFSSNNNEVSIC